MDKAAQYLGLARKGGMLAVGEEGSGTAIAAGKGRLLMLAADASPNAQKRAAGFLYGHRAPLQTLPWTKAELSAMLGKRGCSMLCFTDLPLAARFAAAQTSFRSANGTSPRKASVRWNGVESTQRNAGTSGASLC